jgi:hypothetical protein
MIVYPHEPLDAIRRYLRLQLGLHDHVRIRVRPGRATCIVDVWTGGAAVTDSRTYASFALQWARAYTVRQVAQAAGLKCWPVLSRITVLM